MLTSEIGARLVRARGRARRLPPRNVYGLKIFYHLCYLNGVKPAVDDLNALSDNHLAYTLTLRRYVMVFHIAHGG
jgi:hypothetical protein